MSSFKVKMNQNFKKDLHDTMVSHLRERIEMNYCIEHNQFAKLIVTDQETFQWRIEGCCEALINKTVKSIQRES